MHGHRRRLPSSLDGLLIKGMCVQSTATVEDGRGAEGTTGSTTACAMAVQIVRQKPWHRRSARCHVFFALKKLLTQHLVQVASFLWPLSVHL